MRRLFITCTQFGSLLLTSFGGFYTRIAPPDDRIKFWTGLASLFGGLLFLGVTNLPPRYLSGKYRVIVMWTAIIAAAAFPILYISNYDALTERYNEKRVVCGTVYTTKGMQQTSAFPEKTREELIKDFAGQIEEIWTKESINHSRLVLGLSYSTAVGFLAFSALLGLQHLK